MTDFGKVIEPGTVRFERLLAGSMERVWSFLTDPEKRARRPQPTDATVTHHRRAKLCADGAARRC